jgi:putative inorganic carbon (HCO3(-)) transporter
LLLISAPFLLFPAQLPALTLVALLLLALWWLYRGLYRRRPLPVTPFNGALLLWSLALGVGIAVTAFPALTLPKATGLLLGLATWRFLAIVGTDRRRLRWAVLAFLLAGVGVAALGVLSVRWSAKVPALQLLVDRLPPQLLSLPGAPEAGVNSNQLAGALLLYLPLPLAAFLAVVTGVRSGRATVKAVGALLALAALGGLLLLTQSRSGWVGGVAGLLTLLLLWALTTSEDRLRYTLLTLVALMLVIGGLLLSRLDVRELTALLEAPAGLETEGVGRVSLAGRVEIWNRALYAIQDVPFTGWGLGTFREVIWVLYPLFTISPGTDLAHAHNVFLQVALDTGLPGLVAYLALLSVAGIVGWRVARRDETLRPLALGLLAGLAALHVYGLTDALAPGSKPGLTFWMALGLLAAMERLLHEEEAVSP